jgi:hypothetical protein
MVLLLLPGALLFNAYAHLAGVVVGAVLGRLFGVSSAHVEEDRTSKLLGRAGAGVLGLSWVWATISLLLLRH